MRPTEFVDMGFPNKDEGTIPVTFEELRRLAASGDVQIRGTYIRNVMLKKLAAIHSDDTSVKAVAGSGD